MLRSTRNASCLVTRSVRVPLGGARIGACVTFVGHQSGPRLKRQAAARREGGQAMRAAPGPGRVATQQQAGSRRVVTGAAWGSWVGQHVQEPTACLGPLGRS